MKIVALVLLCASIYTLDDSSDDFRKHYGLSYYRLCKEYVKIFKCLSACKSVGFQIIRMDQKCKCTCHAMKTTTPVPYFKWRTNGTTRKLPKTYSPQLYHIVGTLSPATTKQTPNVTTPPVTNIDGDTHTENGCVTTEEITTPNSGSTDVDTTTSTPSIIATTKEDQGGNAEDDNTKKNINETEPVPPSA
ncbi:hypothetical protein evm_012783 [Chilo suppressalis]|nr:hypothetical protein evm_012783 [Chilo suppressalis]